MKSKIISVLLVSFLSISVTACSNNKASNNKSSDIRISTSSSPTTINTSPDSEREGIKTQLSSENNKNPVMEAYKAVLQNKAEFFSTDKKKNVYLNDFLTNEEVFATTFKVTHFAVLDMDGDKTPEVVLELTVGKYPDFVEVLHYMNGKVYGYIFGNRQVGSLKVDGAFRWSDGAPHNGYGKLRFQPNTSETDILGYHDSINNNGSITTVYFINNKSVTEEAYNFFTKEEDGKKDVGWYEFSQKNIETETTDNSNTKEQTNLTNQEKHNIDNQPSSNTQSNNLNQESKKQEYKAKLDKIELGFKGFNDATTTTNNMYQEVCEKYKQWDDELNEIYGVLKIQLSASDMKKLQSEEIQWIKDRDANAKTDSAEMAGGTMEKVLYEGSLAKSTKDRCYVLVDKYMK